MGPRSLRAAFLVALAGGVVAAVTACRERSPTPAAPAPRGVAAGPGDLFVDGTAASGIDFVHRIADGRMDNVVEAAGAGGAVLDYDGDGRMDLFLVQSGWVEGLSRGARPSTPSGHRLYRNRGDGTFEDVTERAGVGGGGDGGGVAAAAADYDGDGRTDLLLVSAAADVLWRNRGDGTFEDVTAEAGVGDRRCGAGAVFFDADGDGRPDLYVANYVDFDPAYGLFFAPDGFPGPLSYGAPSHALYRNRGDGTFEDVTARSGVPAATGRGMGVTAADLDGDGDQDLYVANDATANWLLRNDGGFRFAEAGLESGTAYGTQGEATAAMAGITGDYDGDGLPDLFVSDSGYGSLFRNLGGLRFADRVFASGLAAPRAQSPAWGSAWIDQDDDGDEDLFVVSGDLHHEVGREDFLFENLGDGTFRDASREGGAWFREARNGRACLAADFDDDGRLDVVVTGVNGPAVLLRGRPAADRPWLTIALAGAAPNTAGLGARVEVVAGGRSRRKQMTGNPVYLGQGDPRLHFGLGTAEVAERVEVRWASGMVTTLRDVKARRTLTIREEAAR